MKVKFKFTYQKVTWRLIPMPVKRTLNSDSLELCYFTTAKTKFCIQMSRNKSVYLMFLSGLSSSM